MCMPVAGLHGAPIGWGIFANHLQRSSGALAGQIRLAQA